MKKQGKHFSRLRRSEMCTAYLFILPMFAGLMLFSIIPFVQNILYSFRKMGTFGDGTFIGLANYRKLLTDDTFWLALKNTAFSGGGSSITSTAFSTGFWKSWDCPVCPGWEM